MAGCGGGASQQSSMHIWFIRHAETENNVLGEQLRGDKDEYNRRRAADPKLSATGYEQVQSLEMHAALQPLFQKILKPGVSIDLYSSPLRRAIETAAPLQAFLPGNPVIRVRPDLTEVGGLRCANAEGEVQRFPGLNAEQITAEYPSLALDCTEVPEEGWAASQPFEDRTVEGEENSMRRVKRITRWIRDMEPPAEKSHAVIIGHGALLHRWVAEILGMPAQKARFNHDNVAVTHIEICGDTTCVHCMNVPLGSARSSAPAC